MVVASYARGGDLTALAADAALVSRRGEVPFVLLADFNTDLLALSSTSWVRELRAAVVRPSNTGITCHQGKGTLIDGAIVSYQLLPYVTECVAFTPPWSPHDVVSLSFRAWPSGYRSCPAPAARPRAS